MTVWRGWDAVGYGRNRSTANALSSLAPGEAPSPHPQSLGVGPGRSRGRAAERSRVL